MLIDRDGPQVPGLGQARDDQINEVARRVRANYACPHPGAWTRIERPHHCETCRDFLDRYILECPDCQLRVCKWCRDG